MNLEKIKVTFKDSVENTYAINVEIDGVNFEVNCQHGYDSSYRETDWLTCVNESGGDIYASGLYNYLAEKYGIEDYGQPFNSICELIESCAEAHRPENTIERILNEHSDVEYTHEKGLFGAFGPADVHHEKYTGDDGSIIVTSEETCQHLAEKQLLGQKWFSNTQDYENWFDAMVDDGHYGDCSVSYRAWKDICGEEKED